MDAISLGGLVPEVMATLSRLVRKKVSRFLLGLPYNLASYVFIQT
jgi:hypothetical protein